MKPKFIGRWFQGAIALVPCGLFPSSAEVDAAMLRMISNRQTADAHSLHFRMEDGSLVVAKPRVRP